MILTTFIYGRVHFLDDDPYHIFVAARQLADIIDYGREEGLEMHTLA